MANNTNSWGAPGASTTGQVLTSNGPSAAPSWQNTGGGGGSLTLIQTQNVSTGQSITFTSGLGTYTYYLINYTCKFATVDYMYMLLSADGGSTWLGNYGGGYTSIYSGTSVSGTANSTQILLCDYLSTGAEPGITGSLMLTDINGFQTLQGAGTEKTGAQLLIGASANLTSAVTGIQFNCTTGWQTDTIVSIYGYSS